VRHPAARKKRRLGTVAWDFKGIDDFGRFFPPAGSPVLRQTKWLTLHYQTGSESETAVVAGMVSFVPTGLPVRERGKLKRFGDFISLALNPIGAWPARSSAPRPSTPATSHEGLVWLDYFPPKSPFAAGAGWAPHQRVVSEVEIVL